MQTKEEPVTLIYKGMITQNTGEVNVQSTSLGICIDNRDDFKTGQMSL